ncbi:MAG: ABC transporter permease, partial [Mesorhizobium sp.]
MAVSIRTDGEAAGLASPSTRSATGASWDQ